MIFRVGRGRATYVAAAALAAVAAVSTGIVLATSSGGPGAAPVRLSGAPLGLNVAPWDSAYAANSPAGGADVIQPLLKAAGIDQLRYGGGSYADYYDWRTNTDIGHCLPDNPTASFTGGCAAPDPLGFGQFSRQASAIGANSFVTVNYGSGTPAEAAAWVASAAHTPGESVALWEVGNENYGCWEVNNELAGPPANYHGYKAAPSGGAQNPACPQATEGGAAGTRTLATSYAVNARRFLRAMKAADPGARIGVPWAFGSSVQGGSVPDSSEWNDSVLKTDGKYVSFVDAHYYPFSFSGGTGGANPDDQRVLRSLQQIPALYTSIRAALNADAPGAAVVVGETAVSSNETTTVCTPVGALFAAGDVLSWLAAGAQSVDWWDMNNYGNTSPSCVNPDFGLFTSSSPPAAETPYDGYLLASVLARPHALLGPLATSAPSDVLGFQSALPDGKHAVAFINIDTRSARTVTFQPSATLSGTLRTWRYAAGKASSGIVTGAASAASVANGITLPAESITVLETR